MRCHAIWNCEMESWMKTVPARCSRSKRDFAAAVPPVGIQVALVFEIGLVIFAHSD